MHHLVLLHIVGQMNCKTYKVEQMIHLLYIVGLTIHLTRSVEQYQMMHRISAIASFYIRVCPWDDGAAAPRRACALSPVELFSDS